LEKVPVSRSIDKNLCASFILF